MKDLKIFAKTVDDKAKAQIDLLLEQKAFAHCKVRIMPDVRTGAVIAPHPKYDKDFEPFTSDCGRISKPIFKKE